MNYKKPDTVFRPPGHPIHFDIVLIKEQFDDPRIVGPTTPHSVLKDPVFDVVKRRKTLQKGSPFHHPQYIFPDETDD